MPPFNVMLPSGTAAMRHQAHFHTAAVDVDEFHVSPIGLEGGANASSTFLRLLVSPVTVLDPACRVIHSDIMKIRCRGAVPFLTGSIGGKKLNPTP